MDNIVQALQKDKLAINIRNLKLTSVTWDVQHAVIAWMILQLVALCRTADGMQFSNVTS